MVISALPSTYLAIDNLVSKISSEMGYGEDFLIVKIQPFGVIERSDGDLIPDKLRRRLEKEFSLLDI